MADAARMDRDHTRPRPSTGDAPPRSDSTQSVLLSFPTISASAFLIGATTATLISLRRGRTAAARQRLAKANSSASPVTITNPSSSSSAARGAIGAASKGPLALFSELNSVAFKRGESSSSSSSSEAQQTRTASALPASLSAKARGKRPESRDPPPTAFVKSNLPQGPGAKDMWSAFDAPAGAPPPSVLMRKRPNEASRTTTGTAERGPAGLVGALKPASSGSMAAIPAALLISKQPSNLKSDDVLTAAAAAAAAASLPQHSAESHPNAGPITLLGAGGLFLDREWDDEDETYFQSQSQQGGEQDPQNESFWTSPAALAVGAFTIATALVGCTAFVGLQVAKAVIGFQTTDEFVQRMAEMVPSRNATSDALRLPRPAAVSRDGATAAQSEDDEELYKAWDESFSSTSDQPRSADPPPPPIVMTTDGDGNATTPLAAAMARLETARTPAEWWEMLKDQLDAEREEDVRARRARVATSSSSK